MISILEFEDRTKKANEILKDYEDFGYIDLMKDESDYLYNYIKDLQSKVIEQQTRLHDIDKRSCDRLKRINEAVELLENPYNVDCIAQCNDAIKKLTGKESEILKTYKN